MFKGIMKLLGGMLGEAVLDEFEDRVESTLDQAKVKIEQVAESVVRKIIAAAFLIIGLIFGLVGISMFLTKHFPALDKGVGYIVVGLAIVIMAMVVNKKKE